ncbi:motility associated factor glycosyltransferase family protein [Lacrimispora amygdalina]|uniref:motility associated factor glycosyltransferase family protein n=1 Tax=Lacrimispora amygdalina TaxID=253257 RepID=UPI00140B2038|nr:6-hydroxymethylpterin diphosphokinase MptE-like protein [Lacrimispora amygdalina]
MKKFKTSDGYQVCRIKKEGIYEYLADRDHYENEIHKLLDTLDGLKFDSVIFLFGIDSGAYLDQLKKCICTRNLVVIFEPNRSVFNQFPVHLSNNIHLVLYQEQLVKQIFDETISYKNINNIYFHAFGNYERIYKKEYDRLIRHLDWTIMNAASLVYLAKRFKTVFIQNMIANMKIINQATPIHRYLLTNKDVPAIVVSGGPSLDQNIVDMVKYKDKLKNYFIITGSRTLQALVKNGIMPDMIVSVDPVDANYEMMKEHLDLDVPLAFYEYSNRYLLSDYKGEKILISLVLSHTILGMEHLKAVYCGGSVSHACIDIANMLGCSPILLAGQDFAHTNQKHHSNSAVFPFDSKNRYDTQIFIKDIHGNPTGSTITLDSFRRNLEYYIDCYKNQPRVHFINCSYGAAIKGAPHRELGEILEKSSFAGKKKACLPDHELNLNAEETIDTIMAFVDEYLTRTREGLELCQIIISENHIKSLVDIDEDDIDLQRILYMLQIVNQFENHICSRYLNGYVTEFLYDIKERKESMQALDYDKLTSNLQYQAAFFREYFEQLNKILAEVRDTIVSTVSEFY